MPKKKRRKRYAPDLAGLVDWMQDNAYDATSRHGDLESDGKRVKVKGRR